ncbi:MAG: alpha/beta hydrolase, partial [Bacteroidales bacterium]|nr:alpha/beta hydrolase [Bacteroidales bacterium]
MKKYYTLIPHTLYFILLNLLLVLGCSAQAGADTIIRMTLTGTDCPFAGHADYGVYVPRTESLKGVLILQHGCGMERHGITRPYDLQYQALAKKWRLAVVETALYGDCGKWRDPNAGTAAALLKILSSAGEKTGHPELDAVPWLLFGHSAGGYWTLAMLKDYPERIMAAVCYSPAFDPAWDYPAAAAKIPLLTRHAGAADANDPGIACWATSVHAFQKLRGLDAPASIAHNTGQNHNFSYIRYMAIPFYEAVMKQRMPEGNSTTMRDLDRTQTWLADTLTRQIYRESEYTGNKSGLCVLPDEATARLWKEYVETGTVTDKTPPPAPFNVKATQDGNSFDVTWDAAADIESGILRFEIFKDGTQAGTVPSSGAYQRFDTNGDNTGPAEVPEMKFRITGVAGNAGTIAVRTMNHSNLASEKTELALGCNAQEASAPYNPAALYDERLGNMPAPALQLNGMGAYTAGGLHITGTADVVKLDKFYALAERMVQYRVRLSADARAVFRSSDNGFAAYVDVPNRRVSIATNPVTEETVDFLQGGREYTVEIYHIYQQAKVRIVDVLSGAEAEIIAVNDGSGGVGAGMVNQGFEVGMQYDHYCFGLAAGTSMLVKQIAVYALKGKVKLLLYGDSITQPEAYFPTAGFPQAWTQCIIGRLNGNAMSSGRGGGTIATVLEYIKNELPYIRAQYVMVTIGTNGGNTEANLGELVEYIRAQGAIPIL